MNVLSTIVKKGFIIAILLVVGITMSFGVMTDEVSAASKKPAKVKISSVSSYDYNAIKVTWKKAKNAKKYQVYRATSKNGKYKLIKTTTSSSYTNKKLTTGKKYYYKVRGVNGSKKGSFSNKKYATPTLKKTNGAKVVTSNHNSIEIAWNKVNGAKGYQIYRSTSISGTYEKVNTSTSCSFKNTGITPGNTYYYKVRAYRVVGGKYKYGSYSSIISATCQYDTEKIKAEYEKAQSELAQAELDLENTNNDIATGEKAVAEAKEKTSVAKAELDVANAALEQTTAAYEKKKADAQAVVDDAQDEYDNAAMSFLLGKCLKYEDSAGNTVDSLTVWKESMKEYETLTPYLGDKFDKLMKEQITVTNFKKYMAFIDECNELRTSDDNFTGLGQLYVDYDLMLLSAVSNAISAQTGYSKGHLFFNSCVQYSDLKTLLFNACGNAAAENLAWGYSDPFDGWYHEEKELYDGGERENGVGHYLNIVNKNYNTIGFSITSTRASEQCFGHISGASLTTDGFLAALDAYIAPTKAALDNAKAALNAISDAEVVSAQTEADKRSAAYNEAVANENAVEEALEAAKVNKSKLEADIVKKQQAVEEAKAVYEEIANLR